MSWGSQAGCASSTSTDALRAGALGLLQDKIQRILEPPHILTTRPEESPSGVRGPRGMCESTRWHTGQLRKEPEKPEPSVHEEREWHGCVPPVKIDAPQDMQIDAHVQLERPSQTALFNMGRPSAQSAKRARAALQEAWWRD